MTVKKQNVTMTNLTIHACMENSKDCSGYSCTLFIVPIFILGNI